MTSARTPESLANAHVKKWVQECIDLCQPADVYWCNGSKEEKQSIFDRGVKEGVFVKLNQEKLPGCYFHRSNSNDVARTEHLTFICTPDAHEVGPTNNWMDNKAAYAKLTALYKGCMKGRTMYVIPFIMGPLGSPMAKVGIELTDSNYVAANMHLMTRAGLCAFEQLKDSDEFTRCLHSLGDVNPDRRFICHFPHDNTIWSFGSGYGGNALLGKKCLALRMASYLGKQQGWMAEHMLLLGATDPKGNKTYVGGAFPSACGKTNFAMLIPPEHYAKAGWKITTVGDDIVWMWIDQKTGKLHGINPEAGYFGVAPGTGPMTNPNAMKCIAKDTIYTNVALLPDGDVWWEGKTDKAPPKAIDWEGKDWTPDCGRKAAHPNSRFTAPMVNNPCLDAAADDPAGVPISALVFGGRRSTTVPLVAQSFNWAHGVYTAAMLGSETTAAASGQAIGVVRRDPMAMLPFTGYNVGEYFGHWLEMGRKIKGAPAIFSVNWFLKNEAGKFVWPGFGENMRVLEWIIGRCQGTAAAVETPLGWMPAKDGLDLKGLSIAEADLAKLLDINRETCKQELQGQAELFVKIGSDMPKELIFEREQFLSRLG